MEYEDIDFGKRCLLIDGEIIGMIDYMLIGGNEIIVFVLFNGLWFFFCNLDVYVDIEVDYFKIRFFVEEVLRIEFLI